MGARKSSGDGALFDLPGQRGVKGGPVYQGVCAQIRALFPTDSEDIEEADAARERKALAAGTIAQARSVAASIDRVSGHPVGGVPTRQAAGMQLAALHAQLDALLVRLSPEGADLDEFDELRLAMEEADRVAAERAREALADAPNYDDVGGTGG